MKMVVYSNIRGACLRYMTIESRYWVKVGMAMFFETGAESGNEWLEMFMVRSRKLADALELLYLCFKIAYWRQAFIKTRLTAVFHSFVDWFPK